MGIEQRAGAASRGLRGRLAAAAFAAGTAALASVAGCSNNPYGYGATSSPTLYRALKADLRSLDPTKAYTLDEASVVDLICPSYFRYHYLKQKPYQLELNLGAEQPRRDPLPVTVQEGGRTVKKTGEVWTFKIKPGIRFQDDPCFKESGGKGREVTAADFILSFKRMADPAIGCPIVGFFQDKILGYQEYVDATRKRGQGIDLQAPVEGLQGVPGDPYTFRVLLNQPYPQLRYLMAMHFTTPIPHEAVAMYGRDLKDHPVGCGPYVLTEYSKKRRLVLEKNPNRVPEYYPTEGEPGDAEAGLLADAGKQLPLTDRVIFNIIRERITIWNLFIQGYIDMWEVTQDNYSQVVSPEGGASDEMRRKGVVVDESSTPNIWYFGFNMTDPVVGGYTPEKRKLRQAISLALDSEAFIDLYFDGHGIKPEWLIPPNIAGYDPTFKNPYRQFNLAKAKQLLAEAGYPGGIDAKTGDRLTIYYDNSADTPEERQFVGLTQKMVEQLGIRLESRVWRSVIWQDRVDKGQFQFIRYAWYADYPDAENFVFMLYGPNRRPGPNHIDYENKEYDRLFEQVRVMDDGPEREALIRQMRAIAVEDCPWVYINHDMGLKLHYEWVKNFKPHGMTNDYIKYYRVDGAERARRQRDWNRPNWWPTVLFAVLVIGGSVPAAAVIRQRRNRHVRRAS